MAADVLRMGEARLASGIFADAALLDGHYLRRSDAEIFGTDADRIPRPWRHNCMKHLAENVLIRRMTAADVARVPADCRWFAGIATVAGISLSRRIESRFDTPPHRPGCCWVGRS